jgi:hypothetical protein
MMKKIFLLFMMLVSIASRAQSVNDYKYALVPEKFSIFKNKNQYRLNTFTKMYMQNYGFETYYDSETQPFDFSNVNCNKVYVDLIEKNNLFITKIAVVLKDCRGNVLATSKMVSTKEKDLAKAYSTLLKDAFESFAELKNYKYNGKVMSVAVPDNPNNTVTNTIGLAQETVVNTQINTTDQLFAQPIANGYQLVDSEPKIIMKIYKTSAKDFYTAVRGELQGALVSKNGDWYFEYYKNDALVSEKINVKF